MPLIQNPELLTRIDLHHDGIPAKRKKNDQEGAQADMAAAAAIRPTIAEEFGSYGIE